MPKGSGPFDVATYRRDKAIGFLPSGITDPKGQPVGAKGRPLTYKDLCGKDGVVDLAKMDAFKQYLTVPEGQATWITPQTMGAPFESGSAQEMLNEYAVRKGMDPETCLKQLVIATYATEIYSKGVRDAKPIAMGPKRPDREKARLLNQVRSKVPNWSAMSVEDQARAMVEYLNQK